MSINILNAKSEKNVKKCRNAVRLCACSQRTNLDACKTIWNLFVLESCQSRFNCATFYEFLCEAPINYCRCFRKNAKVLYCKRLEQIPVSQVPKVSKSLRLGLVLNRNLLLPILPATIKMGTLPYMTCGITLAFRSNLTSRIKMKAWFTLLIY